jgi:hypothetical protein
MSEPCLFGLCIHPSFPQAPVNHQTVVCLARLESFPSVRIRWVRGPRKNGWASWMSSSSRQARPKRDHGRPGGKLWGGLPGTMQILGATPHDSPPPRRSPGFGMPGRVGGRGKPSRLGKDHHRKTTGAGW